MGDHNTQKIMASNETRFIVVIADLIIYEGLFFNIAQKPRFNTVLDMEITPNRNLISKDILDVLHDQNTKSNLILIKKESIFWIFISR